MHKYFKKQAFTLAEVLIVLAILGVIAAITVPSFYTRVNPNEKQCQIGLQKTKIALDDAAKQIMANDMTSRTLAGIDCSGAGMYNSRALKPYFQKYMQFNKICDGNEEQCLLSAPASFSYKGADGSTKSEDFNRRVMGITPDGVLIAFNVYYPSCNAEAQTLTEFGGKGKKVQNLCATLLIDVNGEKGPNRGGYDRYVVGLGKFGVKQ